MRQVSRQPANRKASRNKGIFGALAVVSGMDERSIFVSGQNEFKPWLAFITVNWLLREYKRTLNFDVIALINSRTIVWFVVGIQPAIEMDIFIIILLIHINFGNHQSYKRSIYMKHSILCAYLLLSVAECVGTTAKVFLNFHMQTRSTFLYWFFVANLHFEVECLKQNHVRNSGNANWSWCRLRTPWIHITHQDSKRS